jgi:hypothetical protein
MTKDKTPKSTGTLSVQLGGVTLAAKGRRIGRPLKPAAPGRMASLGLRVTPWLKSEIERRAALSGRTQSAEAEYWLERAFRDAEIASQLALLPAQVAELLARRDRR